jgi:hypothetical protein
MKPRKLEIIIGTFSFESEEEESKVQRVEEEEEEEEEEETSVRVRTKRNRMSYGWCCKNGLGYRPAIVLYGLGRVGLNKIYLGLIGSGHLNPFICFGPLGGGRAGLGRSI